MYKWLLKIYSCSLILLLLFLSTHPAHAAGLPKYMAQGVDDKFSLLEIREQEIRMFGPYSTYTMLFGLPANWELLDGAEMDIEMRVAVRGLSAQFINPQTPFAAGNLTVILNGQTIAILPLYAADDDVISETIPIPVSALVSTRSDGRMQLSFLLSSGETCVIDQQLELVILSSTSFNIPHQFVDPDTSFLNFPRPIYQDSIFQDSARIVVPDQPTAAELQGAYTVAAGLQARTGEQMLLDLVRVSDLTPDRLSNSHLILVGKASTLPLLSQVSLPIAVAGGKFSENDDVGVLTMVPSPWSQERVVLVVSGNSDDAVVKASQALSTGVIRSGEFPNLALIDQVQPVSTTPIVSVDQSLDDLGYDNFIFEGRGETMEPLRFFIPLGLTVTSESFIELSLNHSTLLDYNRSGLFLLLNNQPIGSIRFSDATANQSANLIRISVPPSAVKSGSNTMDIVAILEPIDECSDPDQGGLFVTVWSDETRLFLPLIPIPADLERVRDLSAYPAPFTQSTSLDTTAFILQKDNPESWRQAMRIAAQLGAVSDGGIMLPKVFYADNVPPDERSEYNFLAVGAPSRMPFILDINDQLPAPFLDGGDLAIENDLQVIYKVSPQTPVGYIELLESPWNSNNVIFTSLGNMPQGITWAVNALVDEDIRERLTGNFAVVSDAQVLSTDTRLTSDFEYIPPVSVSPLDTATEPASSFNSSTARPGWLFGALVITGAMIVVVILVIVISGFVRRYRTRSKLKVKK